MSARPRTAQELIHWLESGRGRRWVLLGALFVCGLAVSVVVSWRQFHGAASEATLVQADMARQIASGHGFTTGVNYPQEVAFLRARGVHFRPRRPLSRGLPGAALPDGDCRRACDPAPRASGIRSSARRPRPPYGYAGRLPPPGRQPRPLLARDLARVRPRPAGSSGRPPAGFPRSRSSSPCRSGSRSSRSTARRS